MKAWRFVIALMKQIAPFALLNLKPPVSPSHDARGWLQPYHAAGPYTPAYEDFFFPVSPGDPPPDSRQKAVGWAFPALFHVPGAATWVLHD